MKTGAEQNEIFPFLPLDVWKRIDALLTTNSEKQRLSAVLTQYDQAMKSQFYLPLIETNFIPLQRSCSPPPEPSSHASAA